MQGAAQAPAINIPFVVKIVGGCNSRLRIDQIRVNQISFEYVNKFEAGNNAPPISKVSPSEISIPPNNPSMDNHFSRRPAFGEVAAVGTLYDARNERFLSESLFDRTLPRESVMEADIRKTTCNVAFSDSYENGFKLMGVGNDFGASILARLVLPDGAGRILHEKIEGRHTLGAAIHHQILTVKEKLDPASPGVNECRAPSSADSSNATHIVMEIEWGAQSTLMVRSHSETNKNRFQAQVQSFQKAVETSSPIVKGSIAWLADGDPQISVMAFSDILGDAILMSDPQKFQEAYEFLDVIPAHVKHENNGKGNPGTYNFPKKK